MDVSRMRGGIIPGAIGGGVLVAVVAEVEEEGLGFARRGKVRRWSRGE